MKILKWILGLLAGLAGIVAMFGGQSKKETSAKEAADFLKKYAKSKSNK